MEVPGKGDGGWLAETARRESTALFVEARCARERNADDSEVSADRSSTLGDS
jgi:hypothetical protein